MEQEVRDDRVCPELDAEVLGPGNDMREHGVIRKVTLALTHPEGGHPFPGCPRAPRAA